MAKHIGIVACSAEGAALCYRTLCSEAPALMGEHMHPEVSMHTHPLGNYMVHIRSGNWAKVEEPPLKPFSGFLLTVEEWTHRMRNVGRMIAR